MPYDMNDPEVRELLRELGEIQQRQPAPAPIPPSGVAHTLTADERRDLDRRGEIHDRLKELDRPLR